MYLETYITDVIEGRKERRGLCALLFAMSRLFEAGVWLRHFIFDQKWLWIFRETKVSVPVVSVGNIVAGGTGKTALVETLGRALASKGKVSILSRGYRSLLEKKGKSLHLMKPAEVTPEMCGDEAYLLYRALPEAQLFVGKNRVCGARWAAAHAASLILLDDGMQYRFLHRDLEIVMLHGNDLYGKGYFLPRGYLRDSPKRLAKADVIFVHHIKGTDHFLRVKKEVEKYSAAPLIGTWMRPVEVDLFGKGRLETLEGKRVGVFCALGNPASFFETVTSFGGEIIEQWILPDHISPKQKELSHFARRCEQKGCDLLICSEKDGVKLKKPFHLPLPIGQLRAKFEVRAGREHYDALILKMTTWMHAYETVD